LANQAARVATKANGGAASSFKEEKANGGRYLAAGGWLHSFKEGRSQRPRAARLIIQYFKNRFL
jgi:hypothetical protein